MASSNAVADCVLNHLGWRDDGSPDPVGRSASLRVRQHVDNVREIAHGLRDFLGICGGGRRGRLENPDGSRIADRSGSSVYRVSIEARVDAREVNTESRRVIAVFYFARGNAT